MAERIEDYAMLGDLYTSALVGRSGSVDWLPFPRFDSSSCFGALLGGREHGRWLLAPMGAGAATERRYRRDTLILESEWQVPSGRVRVIDFMQPRETKPDIVRIVEGLEGSVQMRTELVIRFDYGSVIPWVLRWDRDTLVAVGGPDGLLLRSPVKLRAEDKTHVADFTVRAGERVPFVLTWFPSHEEKPTPVDAEQALLDTESFWREWIDGCTYEGDYPDAVHTSLIVLKALTYGPTGGIVAAPTTSLPEAIGGVRNWDYRYCWLRDATLTLLALFKGDHVAEAEAWMHWLLRAVAGDPDDLQIMYSVMGDRRLTEYEVPWLEGFEGSRPVRIGNAASEQLQIDVYGEVMDAMYHARGHGLEFQGFSWNLQRKLLDSLEHRWQDPDEGIWEVRGGRRHFVHSKVMAWVAFDRAVRTVEEQDHTGPVERWREIRSRIHDEVCAQGFNEKLNSFTQSYGSEELDAALLLIPLVGFLPPSDPRVLGTIEAVERELLWNGFVLRYKTHSDDNADGLPSGEGVFLPCSFWLADCYELLGRHDEAHALFDRLVSLRNDLGLLAEEYDPKEKRQLGNFPQAFTHLALVNTAFNVLPHLPTPTRRRHARGESPTPH